MSRRRGGGPLEETFRRMGKKNKSNLAFEGIKTRITFQFFETHDFHSFIFQFLK